MMNSQARQRRLKQLRRWAFRVALLGTTAVVSGLAMLPRAASAADWSVTHTGDSGAGSLRHAIEQANLAGAGNHTITLNLGPSDTITLTDELEQIKVNIAINGNGATLDAHNQHRIFFVAGANVSISNFTLKSALAQGGSGGSAQYGGGGGGGLGAGGAIFVDSGASVSVSQVTFTQNQARGGNGGEAPVLGSNAGGGGGGGLHGNGGNGGFDGGGGGGGFLGNGGHSGGGNAGAGGGGLLLDGGNSVGPVPGIGALTGGNGGANSQAGGDGLDTGGGGGGGGNGAGGAGGSYGGGGGGGYFGNGGAGGFGGGGGGAGYTIFTGTAGTAGFGGGQGGDTRTGGNGGDGLGGAIFVRAGGSLTVTDSTFLNNAVAVGGGGTGTLQNGSDGNALGSGVYLMTGTTMNFSVSTAGQLTMADDIAGAGAVRKLGTGELILTGNNSYVGGTDVDAGRLAINGTQTGDVNVAGGAELGGSGTITGNIINDGMLAAGNSIGTLNVTGNYTHNSGGVMEVEVDDQGHGDRLNVTGDVTINGGTVNVVGAPGNYTAGQSYTFLTYTGTLHGSGFSGIVDDLAFFDAVLSYDPNVISFYLQATATDFADIANTFNEKAVAIVIDGNPHSALQPLVDEMLLMTDDQVRSSLNQLGGSVYGTNVQTQFQNTTAQLQLLAQRLRPDASGGTLGGVAAARQLPAITTMVAFDGGDLVIRGQNSCQPCYNTWGTGYGLGGSAQSDGNAAGLGYALGGLQVGIDRWLDDGTLAGIYGGYNYAQLDGNGLAERVQANSGQVGVYFRRDLGGDYYLAASGLGFDAYDSTRWLNIGGFNSTATANYDGWQSATYLERGRTYAFGAGALQPYAALQYIYLRQNSFSETGAAPANLDVAGIDAHSLRSILGARASREVVTAGGRVFVPQVRAAWLHEFLETDTLVNNRFGSVAGSSFAVQGLDLGRDWALLGVGVGWRLSEQLTLTGNYDAQVNTRQVFHVGSANVQYLW